MSYFNYNGKNIYYYEMGKGNTLILLHGNTLSSKMFTPILDLYKNNYKVVLVDFLGHGKSDRIDNFETDFWYDQAQQIRTLIELRKYKNISIIGTSGGAITAINFALEYPKIVMKVIADSFEGEKTNEKIVSSIRLGREMAKKSDNAVCFWKFNHGDSWEQVLNNDTAMLERHAQTITNYFHKSISELSVPIMFTASAKDDLVQNANKVAIDLSQKAINGRNYIFAEGNHPSIISNAVEYAKLVKEFLSE